MHSFRAMKERHRAAGLKSHRSDGEVISYRAIEERLQPAISDPFSNPSFLLDGNASDLLDPANIRATLQSNLRSGKKQQISDLIEYISHIQKIESLKKENFTDNDLPISRDKQWRICTVKDSGNHVWWKTFSQSVSGEDVEVFASHFYEKQWVFRAAEFSRTRFYHDFPAPQPLPFEIIEQTTSAVTKPKQQPEGNFGSVRKVGIPVRYFEAGEHAVKIGSDQFLVAVKFLKKEGTAAQLDDFYHRETTTLERMRSLRHSHLIQAHAAYQRGKDRGFVFPWADRGSLSDLWRRDRISLDQALLSWIVSQISGLVEGITLLHGEHDEGIRHGDLKPENILVFSNNTDAWGTLVIADVGLAKFHATYTRERYDPTTTRSGSRRYEPPEVQEGGKFSRRYDMWSLGCILLEFVIWALLGSPGLQEFYQASGGFAQFWEITSRSPTPQLRPVIEKQLLHLLELLKDYPDDFALKKILILVQQQLLQVHVDSRPYAKKLWSEIKMLNSEIPPNFSCTLENNLKKLTPGKPIELSGVPVNVFPHSREYRNKNEDVWEVVTNMKLASSILKKVGWQRPAANYSSICEDCKIIDFRQSRIQLGRPLDTIRMNSAGCDMCRFLNECLSKTNIKSSELVRLFRRDSSLMVSPGAQPLVSIYCDPGSNQETLSYAQIGQPHLYEPRSSQQFELINEWIRICDEDHPCHRSQGLPMPTPRMPTRVLDVGVTTEYEVRLRLVEPHEKTNQRYVALSHRWGEVGEELVQSTTTNTIGKFKERINFKQLPKTYQDAVIITRSLHIRYLWIDSLCIIQDDGNDWTLEAQRMGDYYSSAYVTIAASSAVTPLDRILPKRPDRDCVTIHVSGETIRLATAIDDFQADVENSILNTRGWVLQERALSRRTLHFTPTQIYWECGEGIHCETLAQLRNPKSQFLGDCDFPNLGLTYFKNERIDFIQYIHTVYSGLGLTKDTDRSMAIAGLHQRIARTFKGRFDYGVFWKWNERLFLWRAKVAGSLSRIEYASKQSVPSWSWMAYSGVIGYLNLPYGEIDWTGDLENPFTEESTDEGFDGCLVAAARRLTITEPDLFSRVVLDMDVRADFHEDRWMCIVIGKQKMKDKDTQMLAPKPHVTLTAKPVHPRLLVRIRVDLKVIANLMDWR
ncbi:putative Protein kinase domain-containing protein [Seiridium unicorne]|uniref:Protein kinase domain-containing protein n=1 Tax=Seiridium unicorne TaxID=138068 RepID=A0ABR2UJ45_9PEZI